MSKRDLLYEQKRPVSVEGTDERGAGARPKRGAARMGHA
jgi:hypothetical protein